MLTYEDLTACGQDERARASFALQAVQEHQQSPAYQRAKEYQQYYDGENPRIMRLEKIIYDFKGVAHKDLFSANHKIASQLFPAVVDQEVSYLLRNGITWQQEGTAKKLGKDLHRRCADILESAAVQGISFGFWNLDHLERFCFADSDTEPGFAPIYGTIDGLLKAGVRYWQTEKNTPMHLTLYELDGYTEYLAQNGKDIEVAAPKRTYKRIITRRKDTGEVVDEAPGGNYEGFPVIPFRYKKNGESEMQGKRNTVDALDLVTSKMINNVDEGNLIYWVLTNCGGMDEDDDTAFLQQLLMTHVVHADGEDGEAAKAEPHSIEAPFEGTDKAIDRLESRLYKDFRAFNEAAIVAGNQTATAILASYVPLDGKTDKNEDNMTDFLSKVCQLAGVEDEPTYTRSKIINSGEEIQNVLSAASYLGDDYVTEKILTILGDADRFREIQQAKDAEAASRYKQLEGQQGQKPEGEEEDGEE